MKTQQKKLLKLKAGRNKGWKKKNKKHLSLSDLPDITKWSNIHVIGAPEKGEGQKKYLKK